MYNNLLKRGVRIALRSKVNESLITGIRIIDSLLPVGRGQRQLILGDRSTGKSSIFLFIILSSFLINSISSLDGFGSKRLFNIYIGISLNLSKLSKFISSIIYNYFILIIATHSSSSALLNFLLPLIGISISERLRDRGFNICICFDDLSKHSKSFRQINLILGVIPSRDAYPAAVFNVHSSLLERCGKLNNISSITSSGSITSFPIIETINSDITDYIATNVISITDGQFYLSRLLFINSIRPSIDSGLSVSRIGSAAQSRLIKVVSSGLKNDLTNLRSSDLNSSSIDYSRLLTLNNIFYHGHLSISSLSITFLLLLVYRLSLFSFITLSSIHLFILLLTLNFVYLMYIVIISLHNYSSNLYSFISSYCSYLFSIYSLSFSSLSYYSIIIISRNLGRL